MVPAPALPTAGERGAAAPLGAGARPDPAVFTAMLSGAHNRAFAAEAARRAQDTLAGVDAGGAAEISEQDRSERRVAVVDLAAIARAELASPANHSAEMQPATAAAGSTAQDAPREGRRPQATEPRAEPAPREAPQKADEPRGHIPQPAALKQADPKHTPASVPTPPRTEPRSTGAAPRTNTTTAGTAEVAPVSGAASAPSVAAPGPGAGGPRPVGASTGIAGLRPEGPADRRAAASPPAASHRTPLRDADPQNEVFSAQVGRGLAAVLRQGGGSVLLRLQPDALGELKVRLDLKDGVVTAKFEASSDQARRLLDAGLPELKAALEARGLAVERLEVRQAPATMDRTQEPVAAERPREFGEGFGGAEQGESGGREPEDRGGAAWMREDDPPLVATEGDREGGSGSDGPGGGPALEDLYAGGAHGLSIGLDAVA